MKAILPLIITFFIASQAIAQRVPSDCTAPDSIKEKFTIDAARLALRRIVEVNSTYIDSAEIPALWRDSSMRPLLAVYNADLPASDTIFSRIMIRGENYYEDSLIRVRTFPDSIVEIIFMTVDSSFEWARNLRDSVLPTGNRTIDSLFATFNLVRTTAYDFYNGISVWARTETGANMRALANVLEKIPGVLESDPSGFAGGGGDIVQEIGDNLVYLTCSYGWDDCPSGCIEKRFWRFSIFPDCSVRFDSSYGNLLPKEKVYEVQEEGPLFYPNPATDKITIRSKVYNDIVISDIEGKTIRTFKSQQELTEVPVAGLPAGTYFISVREHSGEFTSAKFIKQ